MTTNTSSHIIATDKIGMVWDGSDARCGTCDSRYCGHTCHAAIGTVYIVGVGYTNKNYAEHYAKRGYTVRWEDTGWIPLENKQ